MLLYMGQAASGAGGAGAGGGTGGLVCTLKKEQIPVLLSLALLAAAVAWSWMCMALLCIQPGCNASKRSCKDTFNCLIADGDLHVGVLHCIMGDTLL